MATTHGHVPVMPDRIAALFGSAIDAVPSPVIVDCTLGAGGHTEHLLDTFPEVSVIGVDRDNVALESARARLSEFADRFVGVHARFDDAVEALAEVDHPVARAAKDGHIAGFLFDLGVSSMQLDQPERGFSYAQDAPLDMRMDTTQTLTAADIVNTYSHGEIARILKDFGDERFAGKIASAICRQRDEHPFTRSKDLVDLIYDTIPAPARRTGGHPAKRTFQALRVAVNSELESIRRAIPAAMQAVAVGGAVVVMSYQSHEDKLVKTFFADACTSKTPPGLPVDLPGTQAHFRAATRGAEKATAGEIEQNSRAQSVRVRAVVKLDDP